MRLTRKCLVSLVLENTNMIHTDADDEKDEASTSQGKATRTRFQANKVHTFEGINEENEDTSSANSDSTSEKMEDKERTDRVDELTKDDEEHPTLHATRRPRSQSETYPNGILNGVDDIDQHQKSILKSSHLRPQLEKHLSFEEGRVADDKGIENGGYLEQLSDTEPKKMEHDEHAIDNYYEKNHYTVTGAYDKHHNSLTQLPGRMRRSRAASMQSEQRSIHSINAAAQALPTPEATPRKFQNTFYWLLHNHKTYGFRHIVLLLLTLAYTLLGAVVFFSIESKNEMETVTERKLNIDALLLKMAEEMSDTVNDVQKNVNVTLMERYLRTAYVRLLELESAYKGSTLYKAEDPENNFKWTFGSSFFFSMNVFTTTGYGSIAPETTLGRSCVMWYGFIFVPLTLVVLRDLGQFALVHLTKIYARMIIRLRRARGFPEVKDDEYIILPIKICMGLMAGYLMFSALFVYEYDALSGPPGSGLDFFNCLYFSFISASTIGLGDIMPNNVTFSPLITIIFFFGMPIMKVVNRVTYICIENGVFGTLTVLENRMFHAAEIKKIAGDEEAHPTPAREPSLHSRRSISRVDGVHPHRDDESDEEGAIPNEWVNNFTIRSIATFMKSNGDVYGGGFGRVNLRRGDLVPHTGNTVTHDHTDTVRSAK